MLPRFHPRHLLKRWPERRPFDPHLIGYWPLSEGSGSVAYDESIRQNHGSISEALWTEGKLDRGLLFDGVDDNVRLGGLNLFSEADFVQGISFEVWIKVASLDDVNQDIINMEGVYRLWIAASTDLLGMYLWDGGVRNVASDSAIVTDRWYHVVGTYDGILKLYVDGILQAQTLTCNYGLLDLLNRYTYVGTIYDASVWFFHGVVCELKVYSRALSAADVLRHYLRLA